MSYEKLLHLLVDRLGGHGCWLVDDGDDPRHGPFNAWAIGSQGNIRLSDIAEALMGSAPPVTVGWVPISPYDGNPMMNEVVRNKEDFSPHWAHDGYTFRPVYLGYADEPSPDVVPLAYVRRSSLESMDKYGYVSADLTEKPDELRGTDVPIYADVTPMPVPAEPVAWQPRRTPSQREEFPDGPEWLHVTYPSRVDVERMGYTDARPLYTSPPASAPGVKELEWIDEEGELSRAKTPFGFSYFVNHRTNMWIGPYDDWAVAEGAPTDAAQADYATRIRSALEPAYCDRCSSPVACASGCQISPEKRALSTPLKPARNADRLVVTDEMVERATEAAEKFMPSAFRGEIGIGEFDKMIRAALTATLK